jgi:hypothetical protein
MKRAFFYILLIFSASLISEGQDVKITSEFDSTKIYIGDQIHFTIIVDQPSGINMKLPFFKDTLQKNIEILKGPQIDSVSKDGRVKIIEKYLITSFDSGLYKVNPVYVEVKTSDGLKRYYSDYTQLEVMKFHIAPADTSAKFYDIIDPYRAPLTAGEIIPWVLAAIVLTAIIWGLVWFYKKRRKSVSDIPEVFNPDPAHVIAYRELEKLKGEELWQKGEFKAYYTRLTEILRQYLENRYHVYSLELTTSETLSVLLKTGFKKGESFDRLKTILTSADLIKFAKHIPVKEENEIHFQNSWDFIGETKVEEVLAETDESTKKGEGKA